LPEKFCEFPPWFWFYCCELNWSKALSRNKCEILAFSQFNLRDKRGHSNQGWWTTPPTLIQIIRDTLVGKRVWDSVTKCHKGREKISQSVQTFGPYFCILAYFFEGKRLVFWKIKITSHRGKGGGLCRCHKITYGEDGLI